MTNSLPQLLQVVEDEAPGSSRSKPKHNPVGIFDGPDHGGEAQPVTPQTMELSSASASATGAAASSQAMPAEIPRTPDVLPDTTRDSPVTRQHEVEGEDHEAKQARVESLKKQRLDRISAEYAAQVRVVKFAEEIYHTMDEYDHDLKLDDHDNLDAWLEEEKDDAQVDGMPDDLWANWPVDKQPPEPESWIDRIADKVKLARLCSMGVLVEGNVDSLSKDATLTPKFVYDWGLKEHTGKDGTKCQCWLRRSRFVAREYAFWEKRADTYAPATSTHIINILPMVFLQKLSDLPKGMNPADEDVCLGTLDVKGAFSGELQPREAFAYRSVVGTCLYLARDRPDLLYTVKELSGTGKVKHLSGKVLWIQDAVRNGVVELSQIGTTWDISDIGTKPLGLHRVRFLLHELNMASGKDFMVIGEPEYQVWKLAKDACSGYEQTYTDVALMWLSWKVLLSVLQWTMSALQGITKAHAKVSMLCKWIWMQATLRRLREGHNELQGEVEVVQDSSEMVHFGLVQMGGFTPYFALTPDHRRHMYEIECGNFVAYRTMGGERYMNIVRHQNRGIAVGEDTDMIQEEEDDVSLASSIDNYTTALNTLHSELNQCLVRHDYPRAAVFQQCVMMVLDATNQPQPLDPNARIQLFHGLGDRLEQMSDETRLTNPVVAERYLAYSGQFREMATRD
eukprot:s334_g37.t1